MTIRAHLKEGVAPETVITDPKKWFVRGEGIGINIFVVNSSYILYKYSCRSRKVIDPKIRI